MAAVERKARVALLWHGEPAARVTASLEESRFRAVAEALRAVGIEPEPALYHDDLASEVREQLQGVDGVLVWVNPIEQGRDRRILDALLEEVAREGVFVSAHPAVIRKMGTKEVLVRTRGMSWGSDAHLYLTEAELREQLPARLAAGKARVLKQFRGNGGNGVWKVEPSPTGLPHLRVRHALRGSAEEELPLDAFLARMEDVLRTSGGPIIDQAYQERLPEGMVRCYLVRDGVAGFGHQAVNALYPAADGEAPPPGPRLYHPPDVPAFQAVRARMEREWLPVMRATLGLEREDLPLIWDADFLLGPKEPAGEDTYVLCEINVSSVYPFPDSALRPLAEATRDALGEWQGRPARRTRP